MFLPSDPTKKYLHFGGGVTITSEFFDKFDPARQGITSAMPSSTLQLLAEITSSVDFRGNVVLSCPRRTVSVGGFGKSKVGRQPFHFCLFFGGQIFEKGVLILSYFSFRSVKWVQTGS